ncbi:TetR/AcrR family transcriptional regulator C-terminal ligand-binding domain-containing protein [Microbacterium sp. ARD32]|uniref:TetR/AcrR family transcriptional regulator n=1 Tax=Microbacterium sp. ARD32 TaxID=2962577 RepID=UPI00288102D1|nr:TetR/AcrR family transcriptional regulator C-terminal ligand-binding domain-containing protein [Microbacterium sp. ARD32]MDT0156509.1 TetR/AcrR family transcriptional regulator C-terminal ligand-binding domain-containing protein [Microbacterium sp. ARD32]
MPIDSVTERMGGRSARVREAALAAVAALMTEKPLDEITAAEVAERSGVNRSTLHRRWGGMPGLLADLAIDRLNDESPTPPDAGDLRAELRVWAREVIATLNAHEPGRSPFLSALLVGVRSGRIPAELWQGRLRVLQVMLDRAAARGEAVLSAGDLAEIVLVPIYAAALLSPDPVPADLADRLVDRFLTLARG